MVYFATVSLIGLIALKVICMVYFKSWDSKVFSAITGLIGAITGIFISQMARKFFSEKGFEMSSVSAKKLGNKSVRIQKPPINHPQQMSRPATEALEQPLFHPQLFPQLLNFVSNPHRPTPYSFQHSWIFGAKYV